MEAPPSKTYTLLTSVHNDIDNADNADDADDTNDYNRVMVFSNMNTILLTCILTNAPTHTQTSKLEDYNKCRLWMSLQK